MTDLTAYSPQTAARLLPFDVFDPDFHRDPYPRYRELLDGHGGWCRTSEDSVAVFGFEEAAAVLRDPRFGIGEHPMIADQFVADPVDGGSGRPVMFLDPPDHTRVRGLAGRAFTPRVVDRLRPHAEEHARALLRDAVAGADGGEFDLRAAFAAPLPALVLSRLMDIPEKYHPLFFASVKDSARGLDPGFTLTDEQKAGRTIARDLFITAGLEMAEERRRHPGDDLVSDLVRAEQEGDRLTSWELALLLLNLLAAGFSTTTAALCGAVHNLLDHPDQLAWLREHPDRVADAAEELLRYDPMLQATTRMTLEDADIAGTPLPAGQHVVVVLGAANRDPRAFDRPDTLDLTRPPGRTLAFGQGVHFCVAAPIARMVVRVGLEVLLEYAVERGDRGPERWPGTFMRVIGELPVRLTPVG